RRTVATRPPAADAGLRAGAGRRRRRRSPPIVSDLGEGALEPERLRAAGWKVAQRIGAANIAGAVLVFFDLNVLLPGRRGFGSSIQHPLMITWALCSGIPLLMLGLGPVGLDPASRYLLGGRQWLLALFGLLAGGVVTAAAAKAVSEPLREMRSALKRVQSDDL